MNNEIKINKANKSITFINNGIVFSQFGVANEILDLITNLQDTLQDREEYIGHLEELCDKYEKEHRTTFEYWKQLVKEDYKSRNQKAIEKIKKIQENAIKYGADHDASICQDLLNILQGSDNYGKDEL